MDDIADGVGRLVEEAVDRGPRRFAGERPRYDCRRGFKPLIVGHFSPALLAVQCEPGRAIDQGGVRLLGAGDPMLEAGLERSPRRDEAGLALLAMLAAADGGHGGIGHAVINEEVGRQFGTQRLAAAHDVLGHGQAAVDVLGGERLDQAAERQVRHREGGRLAGDEQAGDVVVAEPHRDRKAGRAARQLQIDQGQIGVVIAPRRRPRCRDRRHVATTR